MTCPAHTTIDKPPSDGRRSSSDELITQLEDAIGTVFVALFAGALFDQTMLPEVSAALVDTGRIRYTPWARAQRTAASDQLVFHGAETEANAEMARLRALHRDVKGVGAEGLRYSALKPENWNWILISTFFMYRGAFVAITGAQLSSEDNQILWDHFRAKGAGLQLPGRSRLIEDYDELCAYYDRVVADKLEPTETTADACRTAHRPPRPPFLPPATAPMWWLVGPAAGHIGEVLGYGIMHPGVREMLPTAWTRRHDLEFTALTTAIRVAYRWLPSWTTDTPLARNRRQYRRLTNSYRAIGLSSFTGDHAQ